MDDSMLSSNKFESRKGVCVFLFSHGPRLFQSLPPTGTRTGGTIKFDGDLLSPNGKVEFSVEAWDYPAMKVIRLDRWAAMLECDNRKCTHLPILRVIQTLI